MQSRITNPAMLLPESMTGIQHLLKSVNGSGLPEQVRELVGLRVSQINGCSACVYGHVTLARKLGMSEERIGNVAAWREAPFYEPAERAALELAEHATRLSDQTRAGVPDQVWNAVAEHFEEKLLAALVLTIALTNFFNRINVSIQEPAGITWG